jgi:hypothetical protein
MLAHSFPVVKAQLPLQGQKLQYIFRICIYMEVCIEY